MSPAIAEQSWGAFAKGDLHAAMRAGGLTLLPGSGISECLKRSTAIQMQFLNLFAASDVATYFKNTYVTLAPDGSLRYSFDIGKEADTKIKEALRKTRIHFAASAAEPAPVVDMQIELCETGSPHAGNLIVDSLAPLRHPAQMQLKQFVHHTPKGTLAAQFAYAASAYGRLGLQPDAANWKAFQTSAIKLLGLGFLSGLSYGDWELFNRICIDGINPMTGEPRAAASNRRESGSPTSVPESFYEGRNLAAERVLVQYFLLASAQFMNLCEDLATLAKETLSVPDTESGWNALIDEVSTLVLSDVNTDWSLPSAAALLSLCSGNVETAALQQEKTTVTYTVKLT